MNASGLQPHWNELLVMFSTASSSLSLPPPFHTSFFFHLLRQGLFGPGLEFDVCPRLTSNSRSLSFYPNSRAPGACCHNQKLRSICLIGKTGACAHVLIAGRTGEQMSAILFLHFQDGALSYKMKDSISTQGSSLNAGYAPLTPVPQYQVSESIFSVKMNPSLWISLLQLESCLCFSPF